MGSPWEQHQFGDLAVYKKGPFGSALTISMFVPKSPETTKVYEQQNAINHDFNLERYFIRKDYAEKMKGFRVGPGDFIVSCAGTIGEIYELPANAPTGIINQALMRVQVNEKIVDKQLFPYLFEEMIRSFSVTHSNGSAIKNIPPFADLKAAKVLLPTMKEQVEIRKFLKLLDKNITLQQSKLQFLKLKKQAYLQKMFPMNNEVFPIFRFEGFTDPWEQRKLKDLASIITKQTGFDYSKTIKPSLLQSQTSETIPFIQNKDFNGLFINNETDFYIPKNTALKFPKILLDQPSLLISISGKIGNVGLYTNDELAFIGGAVGIVKLKNPQDGNWLVWELLSPKQQSNFHTLVKSSSHANITVEDIRDLEIYEPTSADEKEKISKFFLDIENFITLHQHKLDLLKKKKQAYLQNMFPGDGEDEPKWRFEEFV